MFKNLGSQPPVIFYAYNATTGLPATGDAANQLCYVTKDGGTVTAIASNSGVPTEVDSTNAKGYYKISLSQAETNADALWLTGKSSTSNIVVLGAPAVIFTYPTTGILAPATAGRTLVVDASGLADANTVKVGPTGSGTAQTAGDIYSKVSGLTFTVPNYVDSNSYKWRGETIPATNATGVPQVDVNKIAGQIVGAAATVTFPGGTLANTTNITAASGIALAASQHVIVDSGTVTTLTNLPSIPANWITAAGITAAALNGKGDWALSTADFNASQKTSLNAATPASVQNIPVDGTFQVNVVGWNGQGNLSAETNGSFGFPAVMVYIPQSGSGATRLGFFAGDGPAPATDANGAALATASALASVATSATTAATQSTAAATSAATAATQTTASAVASAVLDVANSAHVLTGSVGKNISTAGSNADPLLSHVPGNYVFPEAGWVLGNLPATANVTISPVVITVQNNQIVAPPIAIFYGSSANLAFILQDATGAPIIPPGNATWELVVFTPTPVAGLPDTNLFTATGTLSGSTVNFAIPYTDPTAVGQYQYGLWDSTNHKCYGANRCQIVNASTP